MWRVLLDILAATRRPLVVLDFETAGLGGAPPVEFATLVWAPWRKPEEDETSRAVRRVVPPGLTFAGVQRVDPLQPIEPGASRVHGITDADVRGVGLPAYNDLELRGYFQGLASGDAAEGEGPAVWCGHNAQAADLAWARRWGYLPAAEVDAIDTIRLARRLGKEMPFPLAVDMIDTIGESISRHVPCINCGLDAFAASLTGLHVGLLGERPQDAHGALHDAAATARVLARMLDLWAPLWPGRVATVPPANYLRALLAAWDAPPPGDVSWDGWLAPAEGDGVGYTWRRGKFRGQPAHRDAWVLGLPRLPTGDDALPRWCSQHTADILMSL